MILIAELINHFVNGIANNLKLYKMAKMVKKAQFGMQKAKDESDYTKKTFKTVDSLRSANPKVGPKGLKGLLDEKASNRRKADSLEKTVEKRVGVPRNMNMYEQKNGGKMKKKAKNGTSFGMLSVKAGIDKNPNPTQADRIAGAKKMAKGGMKLAKQAATAIAMKKAGKKPKMEKGGTVSMQLGSYTRQIGKNYSGKAKMGKSMGKCKYGC